MIKLAKFLGSVHLEEFGDFLHGRILNSEFKMLIQNQHSKFQRNTFNLPSKKGTFCETRIKNSSLKWFQTVHSKISSTSSCGCVRND